MVDVDAVLHEESSMLHYINMYYPDPPLMPPMENRKEYARALVGFHEATGVFANVVKPALNHLLKKADHVLCEILFSNQCRK